MKSVILLLSFTLVFSSQTLAEGKLYKKSEKIVLTYNEFRRLSKHNQEAWIKELREFNRKMDLINSGQRITPKKSPKYWSLLPILNFQDLAPRFCSAIETFLRLSAAEAQSQEQCRVGLAPNDPEFYCFTCLGGATVVCEPKGNPETVANMMIKRLKEKHSDRVNIGITEQALSAKLTELRTTNTPVIFASPLSFKTNVQPASVTPISQTEEVFLPGPTAAPPTLDAPFPTTTDVTASVPLPRARPNPLPKPAANTTEVALDTTPRPTTPKDYAAPFASFPTSSSKELQDMGDANKNTQIDSDEKASFAQLACLYGGFAVRAEDACRPVSEMEMNDAAGVKTMYSCKFPPTNSNSLPLKSGNTTGGAVVMCNPILFGLKDQNPICIPRGKNATEECGKKSAEISEVLDLVKMNAEEYRRLSRRVEFLCYADDMTISEHFAKRGKKPAEIDNSIRDLASTCVHIRSRMADLALQAALGNAEAGTR